MYTPLELNRIKWQCRRGMKELDLMVQNFFDQHFLDLKEEDQKIFVELLNETDLNLFRWLLKKEEPTNEHFKHIVAIMLDLYDQEFSVENSQ